MLISEGDAGVFRGDREGEGRAGPWRAPRAVPRTGAPEDGPQTFTFASRLPSSVLISK